MKNIIEIADNKNKVVFKNFKLVNSYYTFDVYLNDIYSNELCINVESFKRIKEFILKTDDGISGESITIRDYDSSSVLMFLNHNDRFVFVFDLTYPETNDYMIIIGHDKAQNIVKQIDDLIDTK